MRAGLELGLAVLVRSLGDVTELQEVRPRVLGQDRAGLVWYLQVSDVTMIGKVHFLHSFFAN